jgi:hypothetical protein
MSEQEDDLLEYDDDDAVAFIQNYLPLDLKGKYSDDDISYVVDLIYEYYESKGYMDEGNEDDEVNIDESELVSFVFKSTQTDGICTFDVEDIMFIILGELDYCDSLT